MFTIKEASKLLKTSQSTLYNLVARKAIGHYRIGGKILFSDDDIQQFLAGCRVEPRSKQTHRGLPAVGQLKHLSLE